MNYYLLQHLKFQIAATIVMAVLGVFYILRPKFNLRSTKMFIALMVSSVIYLVFDYLTVFGLVYYDKVSHSLVDWFHRGFLFFMDLTFLFIYTYLEVVSHHQKKLKWYKIAFLSITMVIATALLFTPVYYHIASNGLYSYGPMIYSAYIIISIYSITTLFSAIIKLIRHKSDRNACFILITMIIWGIFGIIQLLIPQILISSMGIASMILMMYLSLQNPSNYMDKDTDCVNQTGLKLKLQDLLYNQKKFNIINIDLESFDSIQNQMGDENAVKLLNEVKTYITDTLKLEPYRFFDDSFTILLTNKKVAKSEEYLKLIEKRFNERWPVNNKIKIKIAAHIDFICIPSDFDHAGKVTDLMKFIQDCHSYSNDNKFVHRVDKGLIKKREHEEEVLALLKKTIETDDIEMYYQPIYSTADGKFTNVEALVRLRDDKTCGYVSPDEFIPLAEKNYLIVDLSNRIFNRIFDFVSKNDLKNLGVKHVEVNLSAIQSVDAGLPSMLIDLLSQYQVSPDIVNLEVTESVAVKSAHLLHKNMTELRRYGCSFSMDDFGTGYSNLSQIVKTEFELIKIDKSLLWPVFKKENKDKGKSKILLESMIKMIHDMGLKIVVEGVEDDAQVQYLSNLGVDYMQGYKFSRPIREDDYLDFLQKNNFSNGKRNSK